MASAFERELAGHETVGVDTTCFIYHFEKNTRYLPLTRLLFRMIEQGNIKASTSVISLTEILVHPLSLSNEDIVAAYKIFFDSFPNLALVDVDKKIAEDAASIRAMYKLATPDAIHIASALSQGATALVTNDLRLKKVGGVRILALDDFVE